MIVQINLMDFQDIVIDDEPSAYIKYNILEHGFYRYSRFSNLLFIKYP